MTDPFRRFAVLAPHWNGTHWDFLVEDGSTLRTWAIDEPIRADVDLPARLLAAHRALYLVYEGPISGDRGWVECWDRGTAQVDFWTDDRVRLQLQGNQLVGAVEFWAVDGRTPTEPRRWLVRFGKLS